MNVSFFNLRKPIRVVTHSGSFHADDILAVATLQLFLKGRVKVVRSREQVDIDAADYVVDVGGEYDVKRNRFDHHQANGAGARANGIPYASFGLVWKTFGAKLCGSEKAAEAIDRGFVQPVDAIDNGMEITSSLFPDVYPYSFGNGLSAFLPSWKEVRDESVKTDAMFMKAVAMARAVLTREIQRAKDGEEGRLFAEKAYQAAEDKRVVTMDQSYPWTEVLCSHPEPLYAIYPQGDKWHVKAVRSNPRSFKTRKDFPAAWAGLRGDELAKATGVADAIFCHKNAFLVGAKSLEGAKQLAKRAL